MNRRDEPGRDRLSDYRAWCVCVAVYNVFGRLVVFTRSLFLQWLPISVHNILYSIVLSQVEQTSPCVSNQRNKRFKKSRH